MDSSSLGAKSHRSGEWRARVLLGRCLPSSVMDCHSIGSSALAAWDCMGPSPILDCFPLRERCDRVTCPLARKAEDGLICRTGYSGTEVLEGENDFRPFLRPPTRNMSPYYRCGGKKEFGFPLHYSCRCGGFFWTGRRVASGFTVVSGFPVVSSKRCFTQSHFLDNPIKFWVLAG